MASAASLPPVNTVIKDTLVARLASLDGTSLGPGAAGVAVPSAGLALSLSLCEFDDARYLLTAEAATPGVVSVSLALPCDPTGARGADALPAGAAEAVRTSYASYGTLAPQPVAGYALTLVVDLSKFPAPGDDGGAARTCEAERVASLRAVVCGSPLRALLSALAAGQPGAPDLVAVPHRPGEAFFAKRSDADAVTVVYPLRFKDASDATIARTFLAQFPEARRGASLSTAPSCSYSPNAAPLELRGAPPGLVDGANGGYVSLVVFKRHVTGGPRQLEAAVWALSTFYSVVSYHIKCSKAHMHTRMRSRTHSLLQVLNRAKPEQENREKKTASGRAFKGPKAPPAGA